MFTLVHLALVLSASCIFVRAFPFKEISVSSGTRSNSICSLADCDWDLHHCDLTCTVGFGKHKVGDDARLYRDCLAECADNYIDCTLMC